MKKLIQYLTIAFLISLLCFGVVWANRQTSKDLCSGVKIDIINADSTVFVTKSGILKELKSLGYDPVGKRLIEINTEKIERELNCYEYLENVECVILSDKSILIKARQMVPVLRVFDRDTSYYINANGKKMFATNKFHVDVPIVHGHFSKNFSPLSLMPIVNYVESNKALKDLVTMYAVRDSNNIFIIPRIHGHTINFGNNHNIENKFAKLLKFYREVMPVKGWMTYDNISLKWDHQIVASRRNKALKQEAIYDPDEDEQAPDLSSITLDKNLGSDPKDSGTNPAPKQASSESSPKSADRSNKAPDSKMPDAKKPADSKSESLKADSKKPSEPKKPSDSKKSSDKVKDAFNKKKN